MNEPSERSTALPSEWIGQLFRRLRTIYGSRLDSMWAGTKPDELVSMWSRHLGAYDGSDIKAAIDALREGFPEWPPTLFQFADLCRDAKRRRVQNAIGIEGPRTEMPEDVRVKLREFVATHKA